MEDYMVRATATDAQIRAFACTAREMVEKARKIHNTSPIITAGGPKESVMVGIRINVH